MTDGAGTLAEIRGFNKDEKAQTGQSPPQMGWKDEWWGARCLTPELSGIMDNGTWRAAR